MEAPVKPRSIASGAEPDRPLSATALSRTTPTASKPGWSEQMAAALPGGSDMYVESCSYLGGRKFWPRKLHSRSDVHAAIVLGVPYGALVHFVGHTKVLSEEQVARVLGISARTLRRQSETPEKSMPADLASKTWHLAETLAKAAQVFGGTEDAEKWMSEPASGLDGQRPIDLLQTLQGSELVTDFLGRLDYGVYS